ncbi:hypothetical protein B9Z49_05935 [Limnohabitans sp. 2KL-51]|nr:hypothetical protein B9Z49_05935 [Limnohabitans sp. 2KL-51]
MQQKLSRLVLRIFYNSTKVLDNSTNGMALGFLNIANMAMCAQMFEEVKKKLRPALTGQYVSFF